MNTRTISTQQIVFTVIGLLVISGAAYAYTHHRSAVIVTEYPQQWSEYDFDTSAASIDDEGSYPYYLIHAGKKVFTGKENLTRAAATTACAQKALAYTDNGSTFCYWAQSFKGDHDALLYFNPGVGADLALKSSSITMGTLPRDGTQHIQFEVLNAGHANNAASASEFTYSIWLVAVTGAGHTPLMSIATGTLPVPAPGESVTIDVDSPASAANRVTGQTYATFRANIFVNSSFAVDEERQNDENNTADSHSWTITD